MDLPGPLRQDRRLILKEVTPRCPVTVSPPWASGLASVCGLRASPRVRERGWLQTHARARYPPAGRQSHRCLHVQPRGPHHVQSVAVRASASAAAAAFLGLGAGHPWASLEPLLDWRPRWPASTFSRPGPRGVQPALPITARGRSSQADLQPRN